MKKPNKFDLTRSITNCALSYQEKYIKLNYYHIHKQSNKPWYKPWKWYNEFVYFRMRSGYIDITIRGTEGLGPWIDNIDAFPIKDGIYDGFIDGAMFILVDVASSCRKFPSGTKFRIHGHSRGVPLAIIIAHRLKLWGFDIEYVLGWDGPVFSTAEFNDSYEKLLGDRTFLINMKNSAVANIMPKFILNHKFERICKNNVILLDNGKNGPIDSLTNHKPSVMLRTLLNTYN